MSAFPLVAVDIETTGFSNKDSIIEISAVEFDHQGNFGKEFSKLYRPASDSLSKMITEITGLTYDDLKDCQRYRSDSGELLSFIGDRKVVFHNESFDKRFLKLELKSTECTLKLVREDKQKGNSLKNSCIRYGVEFDESKAHRALYDAQKTAQLYCKVNLIRSLSS